MNKIHYWTGGVIAVIILLAIWFNSYNPQVAQPVANNQTETVAPPLPPGIRPPVDPNAIMDLDRPTEQVPDKLAKEFTVTGSNFAFAPNVLIVKKGETVKITLKNTDGFHDLKIDEFNVATKRIRGGESETITFVANKIGNFEYYCSVGEHRAMGMKGTLVVQ